ncbi:hypothetical protein Gotri_006799 [Gossypium trilobum]|uniref:Uncharacterized protein n=1 Tax=Gossypium trilobum TaxID=34281 RepID=A0A7J9FK56_9ROSI|nr:hypothetical protein [Gossypium trilobum]
MLKLMRFFVEAEENGAELDVNTQIESVQILNQRVCWF